MSSGDANQGKLRVLVVGGGVTALETLLALRDLAQERVAMTVLAPNSEFVYRPMTVREPFAYRRGRALRAGTDRRGHRRRAVADKLEWVDPSASASTRRAERDRVRRAAARRSARRSPRATSTRWRSTTAAWTMRCTA